jgi:cell division protein FtsN
VAPGEERAEKPRYSLQVGAFLVKSNAERFVAELAREGYKPYILHTTGYRKRHWYAVRIKDYGDLEAAQQDAAAYRKSKGRPAIVTRIESIQPVAGPGITDH